MGHSPERTCIGCRAVFSKNDVVRIVAGPNGPVVDYREKLPGRASYVCVNRDCIEKACARGALARSLKSSVPSLPAEELAASILAAAKNKIAALLSMAEKAGVLAAGFSAVDDALQKSRVKLLLFADDVSDGTREKVLHQREGSRIQQMTLFTKSEIGAMIGREFAGVCAVQDAGFAKALWKECERVKKLAK